MISIGLLTAVDKSGEEHSFLVSFDTHERPMGENQGYWPKIEFNVEQKGITGYYQFTVIDLPSEIRVTNMQNNEIEHLTGKRIGIAMIRFVYELYGKPITSSSNNDRIKVDYPEFRLPPATWDILVNAGEARYDQQRDIYIFGKQKYEKE